VLCYPSPLPAFGFGVWGCWVPNPPAPEEAVGRSPDRRWGRLRRRRGRAAGDGGRAELAVEEINRKK